MTIAKRFDLCTTLKIVPALGKNLGHKLAIAFLFRGMLWRRTTRPNQAIRCGTPIAVAYPGPKPWLAPLAGSS